MAAHVNTYFKPHLPITLEEVTFTAGVTGLNEMIAYSLTDEGDGILLGRTIYGAFNGDLMTKSKYVTTIYHLPLTSITNTHEMSTGLRGLRKCRSV